MDVNSQEIVEIFGEAGSGKKALLETIHGMRKVNKGVIEKQGKSVLVCREIIIYGDLTVGENIEFFREINRTDKKRSEEIFELMGIKEWKDEIVNTVPRAVQFAVQIACSIIGEFNLLLMDEPFAMLDEKYKNIVENMIKKIKKDGKTVIYTANTKSKEGRYKRQLYRRNRFFRKEKRRWKGFRICTGIPYRN